MEENHLLGPHTAGNQKMMHANSTEIALCVQTLRHSSHYGFHGINGKASLMKLHSFGRKSDDSLVNANSACCMPVYGLLLVPSSQH